MEQNLLSVVQLIGVSLFDIFFDGKKMLIVGFRI